MTNYAKGILLVSITALVSGVSIFVNAFGVPGMNPGLFTGLKNFSVGVIIFGLILFARELGQLRMLRLREWCALALVGLVGGSVPFVLFFTGLAQTTAARGGFIHKTLFIYAAFFAVLFLKERVTKKVFIGLAALAISQAIFLKLLPRAFTMGDLMILIATLFWSLETVLSKKLLATLRPNIVIFGRMFFGGTFIWIYLFFTGTWSGVLKLTTIDGYWIAATTLLLCAYVLSFYHGLRYLPVHVATAVLTLGAPITVTLSAVFLDKTMSGQEVAGGISMLVVTALLIFFVKKRVQAPEEHVLTHNHQ